MLHRIPVVWPKVLLQTFSSSTRDFFFFWGWLQKSCYLEWPHEIWEKQIMPLLWSTASISLSAGLGAVPFLFSETNAWWPQGKKSKAWKLRIFNQIREFCFQADLAAALVGSLGTQVPGAGAWTPTQPTSAGRAVGKREKVLGDTEALMGTIFGRFDCLV